MLRAARWWDVPTLAAIDAELFGTDAWSEATFWSELAGVPDRRWYRVAEVGEQIVGYVGLAVVDRTADVQTVAVRATAHGQGWGGVLLDALLQEADARGCEEVLLEVRADNEPALALYARRGFASIATRRRYYADGTDALILRWSTLP
ncbi:MAG: ribosomal protein S18-alanine N-acetyltransferase [Sporichthyaceae bacterium]